MRIPSGLTDYATSHIISDSLLSSFRMLFNEPALRNTQKSAIVDDQRGLSYPNWRISLDELDKFLLMSFPGE